MKNIRLSVFALVSVAYIVSKMAPYDDLSCITKPLLMPALAVWFMHETRRHPMRFLRREILAGLVFATIGDTLLLFAGGAGGALFFMLGLGAFLFTHLFYVGGFWAVVPIRKGYLREHAWWVLPFVAFLVLFLWWLWPGIPAGMRIPVSAYAAVISVMVLSIINLKGHISGKVFGPMFAGGLLFMLSDSLLALNKFGNAGVDAGLAIMVTYILGQFLIAKSARDILNN